MAFQLVIFDCDGVLVDSETLGNDVLAEILATYGHQISGEELRDRFRGTRFTECLEILEHETGIKLPESFESNFRERASAAFGAQLKPVDGAQRLVESLRIPFCVASSGPKQKIEENLRTTNLYSNFAGKIFSAYEYESWKPDPGLFLAAANHFSVAPEECIVVEDSFVGVSAGVAANMTVLALNTQPGDKTLTAAHQEFQSLDEIHKYFLSQNLARK